MSYVGAFANSDMSPDLLVITSIHRLPREAVRLCRLSDGLQMTLAPPRVHVLSNGIETFEEHVMAEVKKALKLNASLSLEKLPQRFGEYFVRYLRLTSEAQANYRNKAIMTYVIQQEFKRFYHSSYSITDCWRHVCCRCDEYDLALPTLGLVRSRLEGLNTDLRQKYRGI
ncbi:hypothetical protein [Pseudomonas frederiksbergensis]|nr:hypothetical protein [Pseudomonas frederiksbergensis]